MEMVMAICGEGIPILVGPLFIIVILLGIIFTVWRLITYYKNLESKQLNKSTYWVKFTVGSLFWVILVLSLIILYRFLFEFIPTFYG
ncbi:MAG: hypothetical protein AABW90_00340 [Nanoarchaeota archaeon]